MSVPFVWGCVGWKDLEKSCELLGHQRESEFGLNPTSLAVDLSAGVIQNWIIGYTMVVGLQFGLFYSLLHIQLEARLTMVC